MTGQSNSSSVYILGRRYRFYFKSTLMEGAPQLPPIESAAVVRELCEIKRPVWTRVAATTGSSIAMFT